MLHLYFQLKKYTRSILHLHFKIKKSTNEVYSLFMLLKGSILSVYFKLFLIFFFEVKYTFSTFFIKHEGKKFFKPISTADEIYI